MPLIQKQWRRSSASKKMEGIIPAIESAHALSYVEKLAPKMNKDEILVVTISGRGDKDMETIRHYMQTRGESHD